MTSRQTKSNRTKRTTAEKVASGLGKQEGIHLTRDITAISPEFSAACVVSSCSTNRDEAQEVGDGIAALQAIQTLQVKVAAGDMAEVQSMLLGQAVALEAIFTRLSMVAMRKHRDSKKLRTSLALALQAQNAGRASLQTLADITMVRARQCRPAPVATKGDQALTPESAPVFRKVEQCATGRRAR